MTREIPLTRGFVAIVDDDDYVVLSQHKWCFDGDYAMRRPTWKGKGIYMHRIIANAPADRLTDHINGNKLDNRRVNLRFATNKENVRNGHKRKGSSRYKGVHYFKRERTWQASITVNYKTVHLGYFKDEDAAGRAYDQAAQQYFGEFARLNFPTERND